MALNKSAENKLKNYVGTLPTQKKSTENLKLFCIPTNNALLIQIKNYFGIPTNNYKVLKITD
jgi:hypothetical protein